jgi:hypothetical protein
VKLVRGGVPKACLCEAHGRNRRAWTFGSPRRPWEAGAVRNRTLSIYVVLCACRKQHRAIYAVDM